MKKANKKIAIVHDSFTHLGGAERTLLSLIKVYPDADIYTSLIKKKFIKEIKKISKSQIFFCKLSFINWVVNNPDLFKPYIFYYWQKINLKNYDLIISSSHSFCSNWVNAANKHISYIHTPPKFLYSEFNELDFLKKFPFNYIFSFYFNQIRKTDFKKLQKVDLLIANSRNVQKRIMKYYHRKAEVLYPPVKIDTGSDEKIKTKDYYLFFSRLVKQKGTELAIKAFNKNGRKLIVLGEGKEGMRLKNIAKANIKFLGFQPDWKVKRIFKECKALIYCSIDEDFGITPVEAMSHGVPVIAYKSGGVKESIIEGKTGVFFKKYNIDELNKAIKIFESGKFNKKTCLLQAKKFGEQRFKSGIKKYVDKFLQNKIKTKSLKSNKE